MQRNTNKEQRKRERHEDRRQKKRERQEARLARKGRRAEAKRERQEARSQKKKEHQDARQHTKEERKSERKHRRLMNEMTRLAGLCAYLENIQCSVTVELAAACYEADSRTMTPTSDTTTVQPVV